MLNKRSNSIIKLKEQEDESTLIESNDDGDTITSSNSFTKNNHNVSNAEKSILHNQSSTSINKALSTKSKQNENNKINFVKANLKKSLLSNSKVFINCSFCQEELLDKNFASAPFGNLAFCQSTKLYSHSARQTKEIISKGFKNVGLPINLSEQEESKLEEKKKTDEDVWDDISDSEDLHPTKFTIENDKMAEVLTDYGKIPIINPVNGGGAIISHCKHYSHVKCLANYY
jgi:hypothetical protein